MSLRQYGLEDSSAPLIGIPADYYYLFLEIDTGSARFSAAFVDMIKSNPVWYRRVEIMYKQYLGSKDTYERMCKAFKLPITYADTGHYTSLYVNQLSQREIVNLIKTKTIKNEIVIYNPALRDAPFEMVQTLVNNGYLTTHPVVGRVTNNLAYGRPISMAWCTPFTLMYTTDYIIDSDAVHHVSAITRAWTDARPRTTIRLDPYAYLYRPTEFMHLLNTFRNRITQHEIDSCFTDLDLLMKDKNRPMPMIGDVPVNTVPEYTFTPTYRTVKILMEQTGYNITQVSRRIGAEVLKNIDVGHQSLIGTVITEITDLVMLKRFMHYDNLHAGVNSVWINPAWISRLDEYAEVIDKPLMLSELALQDFLALSDTDMRQFEMSLARLSVFNVTMPNVFGPRTTTMVSKLRGYTMSRFVFIMERVYPTIKCVFTPDHSLSQREWLEAGLKLPKSSSLRIDAPGLFDEYDIIADTMLFDRTFSENLPELPKVMPGRPGQVPAKRKIQDEETVETRIYRTAPRSKTDNVSAGRVDAYVIYPIN